MGLVSDIENKVRDYLDGNYEVTTTNSIPSVENVPFGKRAKKMNLTAFCIDLRNSSDLLSGHHKQTSGKIHKAFLTTVAMTVKNYGGKIRSFQGDSLLAFWPADTKQNINKAVKVAMITKWFLNQKLSKYFEKYEKLDFGIGVDWGEVFILRAGISRDANNNDLVFIGDCVNFATRIANNVKGPKHIGISRLTYTNLLDDQKYGKKDERKVDMWIDGSIKYKDIVHDIRRTSWHWSIS